MTYKTCPKISVRSRFFFNHIFHVTQKIQPTLHHTWDEIHSVILLSFSFPVSLSVRKWYMSTVSITFPSLVSKRNLLVSLHSWTSIILIGSTLYFSFKAFLSSLDNVVIISNSILELWKISCSTCLILYGCNQCSVLILSKTLGSNIQSIPRTKR